MDESFFSALKNVTHLCVNIDPHSAFDHYGTVVYPEQRFVYTCRACTEQLKVHERWTAAMASFDARGKTCQEDILLATGHEPTCPIGIIASLAIEYETLNEEVSFEPRPEPKAEKYVSPEVLVAVITHFLAASERNDLWLVHYDPAKGKFDPGSTEPHYRNVINYLKGLGIDGNIRNVIAENEGAQGGRLTTEALNRR